MENQRKFPRIEISGIIRFARKNEEENLGNIFNISENGLQFFTKKVLSLKNQIDFNANMDKIGYINGSGSVVYAAAIDTSDYGHGCLAGMQFIEMKSIVYKKIHDYINDNLYSDLEFAQDEPERRRYRRAEIKGSIKISGMNIQEFTGTIINLSQNGIKAFSKNNIYPLSLCKFNFAMNSDYAITGSGQVIYSEFVDNADEAKKGYILGIQFLELDYKDIMVIHKYIEENSNW